MKILKIEEWEGNLSGLPVHVKKPDYIIRQYYEGYQIVTNEEIWYFLINGEGQCCERWGYFDCGDDISEVIGKELKEIYVTDTALKSETLYSKMEKHQINRKYDSPSLCFVNVVTTCGASVQLAVYNEHEGYYGHDVFVLKVPCAEMIHETGV